MHLRASALVACVGWTALLRGRGSTTRPARGTRCMLRRTSTHTASTRPSALTARRTGANTVPDRTRRTPREHVPRCERDSARGWTHGQAQERHSLVRKAERRRFERRGLGARTPAPPTLLTRGATALTLVAGTEIVTPAVFPASGSSRVPIVASSCSGLRLARLVRVSLGTTRFDSIRSQARESPAATRRSS